MTTPINASDAAIGATYLTQRGLRVTVQAHVTNGTRVATDDGIVSILDRAHKLTAVDTDTNTKPTTLLDVANVIGKPKAVIADVICDLTDDQLAELEEADTRAFVEFLVRDQRAFRAKSKVIPFAADNAPSQPREETADEEVRRGREAALEAAAGVGGVPIRLDTDTDTEDDLVTGMDAPYAPALAPVDGDNEDDVVIATYPPADDATMERMRESSEDALPPTTGTYPPPEQTAATVVPTSEPAPVKPPRTFPRGWCPVCGHEGQLTQSGRIRAHQREGAPCEGQQALHALTAPPTPASLRQAEVDSVPEAKPGTTEPCDLHDEPGIEPGGSDYEAPAFEPVGPTATLEQQLAAREAGYKAAAAGMFTPPAELTADEQAAWTRGNDDGCDDLRHGVVRSITGMHMGIAAARQDADARASIPVVPPGYEWKVSHVWDNHDRAAAMQAHLRALADAIPAMLAGQEAIDRLKALGLDITATLGAK